MNLVKMRNELKKYKKFRDKIETLLNKHCKRKIGFFKYPTQIQYVYIPTNAKNDKNEKKEINLCYFISSIDIVVAIITHIGESFKQYHKYVITLKRNNNDIKESFFKLIESLLNPLFKFVKGFYFILSSFDIFINIDSEINRLKTAENDFEVDSNVISLFNFSNKIKYNYDKKNDNYDKDIDKHMLEKTINITRCLYDTLYEVNRNMMYIKSNNESRFNQNAIDKILENI